MKNESDSKRDLEARDDPRLTAYVLDELPADERDALEHELASDAALAQEVRALDGLATGLRAALTGDAEPQLDDSRRREILRAAGKPRPRSRFPRRIGVALAAGIVAALGATVWFCFEPLRDHRVANRPQLGPIVMEPRSPDVLDPETLEHLRGLGYTGYGGNERDYYSPPAARVASAPEGLGYVGEVDRRSIPQAPNEATGTESYDSIHESGFRETLRAPLSTLSIDVDTASYANVRRFLTQRTLPPVDAVRIEELVNYFRYDYPEPRGAAPFSVSVDGASAPWEPEHRLVRIGLRGRSPDLGRPRVKNLVFLVDVSGSMDEPDKLPLVQRSLRLLVDELSGEDRVALVVYAGRSGLVLPATSVSQRARILDAIDALDAGGSTNGGSGIQLAYSAAREHFAREGVNRVILATDGDFNVGITDRAELLRLIEDEAQSGVFLSVLGFGTGNLKDATMEQLADHGNGNYAYVDSLAEARKVLVREMGATLETIAKDVKIQVEFNPAHVSAWRLVGYENRLLGARDFADDRKDAGEIGAGHTVTALYEIVPVGAELGAIDALRYQSPATRAADGSGELLTVALRYKEPDADRSELLNVPFTDEGRSFESAAPDLRFAAAVAAFGLCLRASPLRGNATLADVHRWAESALGPDVDGDRREFLRLVDIAAGLSGR